MPVYGRIPKLKGIVGGGGSSRGRKQQGEVISDRDRCLQCKGNEVKAEKKVLEVHVEKGMQHAQKISFSGEADEADFLRSREVGEFLSGALAGAMTKVVLSPLETIRYGYNRRWSEDEKGMRNNFTRTQIRAHKKRRLSFLPWACFALVTTRNSTLTNFYQEVIEAAREKFTREISFQSKDKDISLAKSPGVLAAFLVWLSAAMLEWLCIVGLRCCVGIAVLSWLLCYLCSAVLVFPAAVCSAAILACCWVLSAFVFGMLCCCNIFLSYW